MSSASCELVYGTLDRSCEVDDLEVILGVARVELLREGLADLRIGRHVDPRPRAVDTRLP